MQWKSVKLQILNSWSSDILRYTGVDLFINKMARNKTSFHCSRMKWFLNLVMQLFCSGNWLYNKTKDSCMTLYYLWQHHHRRIQLVEGVWRVWFLELQEQPISDFIQTLGNKIFHPRCTRLFSVKILTTVVCFI